MYDGDISTWRNTKRLAVGAVRRHCPAAAMIINGKYTISSAAAAGTAVEFDLLNSEVFHTIIAAFDVSKKTAASLRTEIFQTIDKGELLDEDGAELIQWLDKRPLLRTKQAHRGSERAGVTRMSARVEARPKSQVPCSKTLMVDLPSRRAAGRMRARHRCSPRP